MIRILHSVSNMDRAGIETMLMNYYRHIDRTEIQFDFLCNKTKPGAYDDEIKAMGGKIYHSTGLNPFKYPKYLKYMKQLFSEHPEYKIVHAHNGAFVVYPLFASKKNGIPKRISHIHGASFTIDYKWPLKLVCKPLIPFCATDKWACGTEAGKFYYGKKAVDKGEVFVLNNAIEIQKFLYSEQLRNKLREQYHLEDKIVIGHAGRFATQKNHTFLIDVFAEVHKKKQNTVLLLLGDGELMDEMKAKVKTLGLTDDVLFMGNVDNVNEFYQAMDIFVLPSVWEGLPVVGVEAQTADLPCVFSDNVTHEIDLLPTTVYLKLNEPLVKWADSILKYTEKPHKRKDNSAIIKEAGYDIDTEAKKLLQIYKDMWKVNS